MSKEFEKRTIKIAVLPKGKPLLDEQATFIEIMDEAGGEFLEISQSSGSREQSIRLDDEEWPLVRDAIEELAKEIKKTSAEK